MLSPQLLFQLLNKALFCRFVSKNDELLLVFSKRILK
jgi:hypothetical protein